MRAHFLIAALATSILIGSAFAANIPKFDESMLVSGSVLKEQRPEYPLEARTARIAGSGVFILNISKKTGRVDSIQIKKSTGYALLDRAAMKAVIAYRFRLNAPSKVWIPIEFTAYRR